MTLYRYTLVAASLSFTLFSAAQAPITLVAPGNVPANGTSFLVHKGAYTTPSVGGADQLFDYSASVPASAATYQWQDPAGLPNSAMYTGAQYALTNGGSDTLYYASSASGLERVGDAVTIMVGTTPYHGTTVYSNSMLELPLPYSYSSAPWTDLFTGSYTVDGNTTTRNGAITGQADGWGRLIMPGGMDTVEVLRIKTRVNETIPLNVGLPVNVDHVNNELAYYPLWGKFPVLRVVSDSLSALGFTQQVSYTEWLDAGAVGIADAPVDPWAVKLFPNPAAESVNLAYLNAGKGALILHVLDARGSVVLARTLNNYGPAVEPIDVSKWAAGLYQVVLSGSRGVRSMHRLSVVR
jgi:hypothetical protein